MLLINEIKQQAINIFVEHIDEISEATYCFDRIPLGVELSTYKATSEEVQIYFDDLINKLNQIKWHLVTQEYFSSIFRFDLSANPNDIAKIVKGCIKNEILAMLQ